MIVLLFSVLFTLTLSQTSTQQLSCYWPNDRTGLPNTNTPNWYYWTTTDWPDGSTQDFETLIDFDANTGIQTSNYYLDKTDFIQGGAYFGKTWQEAFYTDNTKMRPLGYKFAQVGANNNPIACLQANGAANYAVDLMIYTLTPMASICAQDLDTDQFAKESNSILRVCGRERIYKCFPAINGDSNAEIRISVYCLENCEDGQAIDILFRFRRSRVPFGTSRIGSTSNPEMWCEMISDRKDWPDDIEDALPETYHLLKTSNSNKYLYYISIIVTLIVVILI